MLAFCPIYLLQPMSGNKYNKKLKGRWLLLIIVIFIVILLAITLYTTFKSNIDAKSKFISPLLRKDQQYTFYLSEYYPDDHEKPFTNPLKNTNLYLYFMSEVDCPAIELTFLSMANSITRRVVDPCNKISPSGDLSASSGPFTLGSYSFVYRSDSFSVNNFTLLVARSLFASSRVAIAALDGKQLPDQDESYPQIPAEFFVTSF